MRSLFTMTLLSLLLLFTLGCGQRAQRIDSTQRITTVDQLDIQDWEEAADELLHSLLTRGPISGAREKPAVVAVSRIVNDTTRSINTHHLTDYVLTELNRSGRAHALMFDADDPLLREQIAREERLGEREVPVREFDYTVSGRIIEEQRSAGRTRQSTFVFTLRVSDPNTGTAVWMERKTIDKQGTRSAVGM